MKTQLMYKITLFDANCPSCTSGVIRYFTDDINYFKNKWEQLETNELTKERFNKSLNGEIITDYYSNEPELNIVQKDDKCKIIKEKEIVLEDTEVTLENSYGYPSDYYIKSLKVLRKYVEFNESLYRLDKFIIDGIAKLPFISTKGKYEVICCYGNPIIEPKVSKLDFEYSDEFKEFENEHFESICYIPTHWFDNPEDFLVAGFTPLQFAGRSTAELLEDLGCMTGVKNNETHTNNQKRNCL